MKKIFTAGVLLLTMMMFMGYRSDSAVNDKLSVMLGSNVVSLDSAEIIDSPSLEVVANCIDGLIQLDVDSKTIPATNSQSN